MKKTFFLHLRRSHATKATWIMQIITTSINPMAFCSHCLLQHKRGFFVWQSYALAVKQSVAHGTSRSFQLGPAKRRGVKPRRQQRGKSPGSSNEPGKDEPAWSHGVWGGLAPSGPEGLFGWRIGFLAVLALAGGGHRTFPVPAEPLIQHRKREGLWRCWHADR